MRYEVNDYFKEGKEINIPREKNSNDDYLSAVIGEDDKVTYYINSVFIELGYEKLEIKLQELEQLKKAVSRFLRKERKNRGENNVSRRNKRKNK